MDAMTVHVEAKPGHTAAPAREALAATLATLIKNNIGSSARIAVAEPGGIERSMGKAKRIVDSRPKE